jgi:hypothetical protein
MRVILLMAMVVHLTAVERQVVNLADDGPGSLRQALSSQGAAIVVSFAPALAGKTIVLSRQIEIQADAVIDAGKLGVTVSGAGRTRLFRLMIDRGSWAEPVKVTMRGLTLTDGCATGKDDATGSGGAALLRAHGTTLTLDRCIVRNNRADHGGGGVRALYRTQVTAIDTLFENNDGTTNGVELGSGAVSIGSEGVLEVRNCVFRGNRGINGGAIGNMLSRMTVEDSLFEKNVAVARAGVTNHGGGIYTDGASAKIDDDIGDLLAVRRCRFIANEAAEQGGGAFLWGYKLDRVEVTDCWFERNQATAAGGKDGLGGGIRFGPAEWVMTNTHFDRNQARRQGGALWISTDVPSRMVNCILSGNAAGVDPTKNEAQGGALMVAGKGAVLIEGCTIAENVSYGGGILFGGQALTFTRCLFSGNRSGNNQDFQATQVSDGGGNQAVKGLSVSGLKVETVRCELTPFAQPEGALLAWRLAQPAVSAGTRMPEVVKDKATAKDKPAPAPRPAVIPPQVVASAQPPFLAALRQRLEAVVAHKRGPTFAMRSGRGVIEARVDGLSGDDLELRIGTAADAMSMTTPFSRLQAGDRAALAKAMLSGPGDDAGYALVAYWSLAAGDLDAGMQALEVAGRQSETVKAAFTWPPPPAQ